MMTMPVLSSQFLIRKKPNAGFFSKWRPFHAWSQHLLPVYEWSDILFVACNGSAETIEIPGRQVVFVILDSKSLEALWSVFDPEMTLSPQSPQSPPSFSSHLDLHSKIQTEVEPQFPPQALPQIHQQLLPQAPLSKPDPEDIFALMEAPHSSDAESVSENSSLLNLTDSFDDLLDLNLGNPTSLNSQSSNQPLLFDLVRATPIQSEVLLSSKEPKYNQIDEVTHLSLQSLQAQSPDKTESWLESAFHGMSREFQKSMILLKQGDQVRPWKWDNNFPQGKSETGIYSLIPPSPFRIVLKTQKSYHGTIITNEVTQKFLSQWSNESSVEHLTLSPIIVDDHVIGMLMGLGNLSARNKSALKLCEDTAEKIAKHIEQQPQDLKVA